MTRRRIGIVRTRLSAITYLNGIQYRRTVVTRPLEGSDLTAGDWITTMRRPTEPGWPRIIVATRRVTTP